MSRPGIEASRRRAARPIDSPCPSVSLITAPPSCRPGASGSRSCSASFGAVLSTAEARELALSFPEAVEADHHGRPSFRVGGKIFATLWTPRAMNVMAAPERIEAAVADAPEVCSPVHWGKRLAAVRVDLDQADAELLEPLLAPAWTRRAPRRLSS